LASVNQIPVGGGVIVPEPPIVITQPVAGTFKAFTAICPHQGCLVSEVAENQIVCPCHGSLFSAEDGAVVQGPAEQGLTAASIEVNGDSIVLA
jgi:Rieske Fe-S protein